MTSSNLFIMVFQLRQTTMLIFIWTLKKKRRHEFSFLVLNPLVAEMVVFNPHKQENGAHDWLLIVDCERNHLIM